MQGSGREHKTRKGPLRDASKSNLSAYMVSSAGCSPNLPGIYYIGYSPFQWAVRVVLVDARMLLTSLGKPLNLHDSPKAPCAHLVYT